jgi:L-2-hydroxycarboxylate dehydrogenase (NAD+)
MIFPYQRLLAFTIDIFRRIGCPEQDAHTAAIALLSADLRGIDSHGVARLIGYVRLQEAGRANPTPISASSIKHPLPPSSTATAASASS